MQNAATVGGERADHVAFLAFYGCLTARGVDGDNGAFERQRRGPIPAKSTTPRHKPMIVNDFSCSSPAHTKGNYVYVDEPELRYIKTMSYCSCK